MIRTGETPTRKRSMALEEESSPKRVCPDNHSALLRRLQDVANDRSSSHWEHTDTHTFVHAHNITSRVLHHTASLHLHCPVAVTDSQEQFGHLKVNVTERLEEDHTVRPAQITALKPPCQLSHIMYKITNKQPKFNHSVKSSQNVLNLDQVLKNLLSLNVSLWD